VLDASASTIHGFLGEIHALPQLSCIGLFGAKRAYLYLETPKLQEVFLSKLSQFSKGKHSATHSCLNRDGFLSRDKCVSSMLLSRPILEKNQPFSSFKCIICRKYSFHTLPELSQGIIVLDVATSNIPGCLWRETYAYQLS
jgi:hypothetical protein